MKFGGLQKFSLLDYPGKISAIIFTQGCNFRCRFCYNPMLVWPEIKVGRLKNTPIGEQKGHTLLEEDDLFAFLEKRKNKLEAVVITGGEPTLWPDLPAVIAKIKSLGYCIKLDTNGTNPKMLKKLISEKLVDYIAMDIKAPMKIYPQITGIKEANTVKVNFENIPESVKIIKESGLPYEFRTTVPPGLLNKENIEEIGKLVKGAEKWYLQKFKSDTDLVDEELKGLPAVSKKEMEEMKEIGKGYVKICEVR